MNFITITFSVFLLIGLLIFLYGLTKPRVGYVVKEIVINASTIAIFEYANDLQKFVAHWSPWTDKDPEMKTKFNAIETGVGSRYTWNGHAKKVGFGAMEIIKSEPTTSVNYLISFGGKGDASVNLSIEKLTESTSKVTWEFSMDSGYSPTKRIFGTLLNRMMGPDFELGLKKLKETCEKK